ncbi:MAG: HD domain-containing protein [Clostridia bacterium]|nr:HD domain-containing protein [Clostridia bacterium]
MKRPEPRVPDRTLAELEADARVQQMKQYVQHGRVSTFAHCESVAALSRKIDKALHLHADAGTLLTGALLHDFYLYDWHDGGHRLHGFRHAELAARNAARCFGVSRPVQHVIRSHMWPLNISRIPHSRETWIVCVADKCVSLYETVFRR